jgi:glycerol-3-phosphate responsive antiterminator
VKCSGKFFRKTGFLKIGIGCSETLEYNTRSILRMGLLNNSKMRSCHQTVGDQKRIEIFPGVFKKLVQSVLSNVEGKAAATGTGGAYE